MVIYGVALLSGCYMAGNVIGDILGALLGVKANIGGVGFAMLFLIIISENNYICLRKNSKNPSAAGDNLYPLLQYNV